MEKYQYIVIGAGPAGCYAASRLKDAGKTVLILEQHNQSYRKVCGDGISTNCFQRLQGLNFPVERFEKAGAIRIKYFYTVKNENMEIESLDNGRIALGCSRDITDRIFQDFANKDYGVKIVFGCCVRNIIDTGEEFIINNYHSDSIILANGVSTGISINGQPISEKVQRPFGVSMVVKTENTQKDPFFLFDRDWGKEHTYAWIFSIGEQYYNVGMWKRDHWKNISSELMDFYYKKADMYIHGEKSIVGKIRGAFLGIGEPVEENAGRIMRIGDAANCCNVLSGEGISEAVLSAERLVNRIVDNG